MKDLMKSLWVHRCIFFDMTLCGFTPVGLADLVGMVGLVCMVGVVGMV